jgi:hypothetical protein
MSSNLGIYPLINLEGQVPAQVAKSSGDLPDTFGELNEQMIFLRREDIGTADPWAPELDWSKVDQGEIAVRLKDTHGILDGRITVKASTLHRVCPAVLPVHFDGDYLFAVSLRTVVLQVQASLNQNLGKPMTPICPDFDTSIAQVAREDEGFLKLDKLAQSPPARAEERAETTRVPAAPPLTPADRPSFPLIRNRLPAAGKKSGPASAQGPPSAPRRSAYLEEKETPVEIVGPGAGLIAQKPRRRIGLERLQEIFMTEELLDARQVAKLVAALPKVKGALIILEDGALMGGEFPEACHLGSALLAPAIMRTVQEFSRRLSSSEGTAFTIFGDLPVSVFAEGKVCILIAHGRRGLLPGMVERIGETARALDALYT